MGVKTRILFCTLLLSGYASQAAILAPPLEPDDAPQALSSSTLPTTPPFPIPKRIPKLPSKLVANDSSPKVIPIENKPVAIIPAWQLEADLATGMANQQMDLAGWLLLLLSVCEFALPIFAFR